MIPNENLSGNSSISSMPDVYGLIVQKNTKIKRKNYAFKFAYKLMKNLLIEMYG